MYDDFDDDYDDVDDDGGGKKHDVLMHATEVARIIMIGYR